MKNMIEGQDPEYAAWVNEDSQLLSSWREQMIPPTCVDIIIDLLRFLYGKYGMTPDIVFKQVNMEIEGKMEFGLGGD